MNAKFSICVLFFILFSCAKSDDSKPIEQINKSGVVISFDDDYVNEWYDVDAVLNQYDWKATFFVTRFNQLSIDKVQKITSLKNNGHEIGGHGLNHLNAPSFIASNGVLQYQLQEITPMMNVMNASDIYPTSFAYPYGARNEATDQLLFNNFKVLRGTTYGDLSPASQNCYYFNKNLIYGLGIDKSYSHYSISYFISLLEYAKKNNKIVIFYAHKPVPMSINNYETEYQTLVEICKYVKQNNMKFYKISELYNLNMNN
jgi:hypothetical protein